MLNLEDIMYVWILLPPIKVGFMCSYGIEVNAVIRLG